MSDQSQDYTYPEVAVGDPRYFDYAYHDAQSGADLVIQTRDGIHFRVHSYFLRANSTFFRSMPMREEMPTLDSTDSTIHVEADSAAFRFILNLLTDAKYEPEEAEHDALHDLFHIIDEALEVGQRLGFTQLPRMVLPVMHNYVTIAPWYVFQFAAKHDFIILAVYTLERMAEHSHFKTLSVFDMNESMLNGLPNSYIAPLIRNMALFRMDTGEADWEKVAYHFPDIREGRNGAEVLAGPGSREDEAHELSRPDDLSVPAEDPGGGW